MNWTPLAGTPTTLIASEGPYQALVWPRKDRGWQWTLAYQPAGEAQQTVGTGVTESRQAAQSEAETRLLSMRRPGRPPKLRRTMTSTDRSKRRTALLAARAIAGATMTERLASLRRELAAEGHADWAERAAKIYRVAALRALAEYTRRNATFFVTSGPQVLKPGVRARHIDHITALANQVDALADTKTVKYVQFEAILQKLHDAGFWPEQSLVSDVANAFVDA